MTSPLKMGDSLYLSSVWQRVDMGSRSEDTVLWVQAGELLEPKESEVVVS